MKTSGINLWLRYKSARRKVSDGVKQGLLLSVVPVLIVALIVVSFVYFNKEIDRRQSELDMNNGYLNDPQSVDDAALYQYYTYQYGQLVSVGDANSYVIAVKDSFPIADSEVFAKIADVANKAGITAILDSYDSVTGAVSFTATSPEAINVNEFIYSLYQLGIFSKVDYIGYHQEKVNGQYKVRVECSLSAPETQAVTTTVN